MPQGIYSIRCGRKSHDLFYPNPHQLEAMNFFIYGKDRQKGLLLYHKLGSGKTCTAILIADRMLDEKLINHVYFFTPGSLRSGWVEEYCRVCGEDNGRLHKYFTFITYNYSVGNRLPDLNNSLVIIDECHNIINGFKNQSKTYVEIYNKINSSNCRILALSGTPIFNYVAEWPILGNLLKPNTFPVVIGLDGKMISERFTDLFNIDKDGVMMAKSPVRMRNMMSGIVSFFPGSGEDHYPTVYHMEPIKVKMTVEQAHNYWDKVEQEIKLKNPPKEFLKFRDPTKYDRLKQLYIMAKKNILSRSASNFYYPKDIKKIPDLLVSEGGWIDHSKFNSRQLVDIYSTKFTAFFINFISHINQKHVLFTFFKEKAGVILLHSILEMCGIKSGIFSGDLDDVGRKFLLKTFNSKKNRYGDKLKILLVTEAGAEGITILEARHIHILESSPRETRIQQAIGRVVRYKSHSKLPRDEQNVKVWRYWSVGRGVPFTATSRVLLPNGETEEKTVNYSGKEPTIDEILYDRGVIQMNKIKSLLRLLESVSVTSYKHT